MRELIVLGERDEISDRGELQTIRIVFRRVELEEIAVGAGLASARSFVFAAVREKVVVAGDALDPQNFAEIIGHDRKQKPIEARSQRGNEMPKKAQAVAVVAEAISSKGASRASAIARKTSGKNAG